MPRILGGYDPCLDDYTKNYYNRADVQKALHVTDGHRLMKWDICSNNNNSYNPSCTHTNDIYIYTHTNTLNGLHTITVYGAV